MNSSEWIGSRTIILRSKKIDYNLGIIENSRRMHYKQRFIENGQENGPHTEIIETGQNNGLHFRHHGKWTVELIPNKGSQRMDGRNVYDCEILKNVP